MLKAWLFFVIAVAFADAQLSPSADDAPNGKASPGTVDGYVISAANSGPIPDASVELACQFLSSSGACGTTKVKASLEGKFRFENVAPGSYLLIATAAGFSLGSGNTPVAVVSAGQSVTNMELKLTPWGSVSGKVVDSEDHPVSGVEVRAFKRVRTDGIKRLQQDGTAISDSDGMYQVPCKDGAVRDYLLVAGEAGKPVETGKPHRILTYYPHGRTLDDAAFVRVKPGDHIEGLKIEMQFAITRIVSGKVVGAINQNDYPKSTLSLTPLGAAESDLSLLAVPGPNGSFHFEGVVSGSYVLRLIGYLKTRPGVVYEPGDRRLLAAEQEVEVGLKDINELVVYVPRSIRIEGRFRWPGEWTPDLKNLRVYATSLTSDPHLNCPRFGRGNNDGTFTLQDLAPMQYVIRMELPPGAYADTIEFNGQDGLHQPLDLRSGEGGSLEISLNHAGGGVSGRLSQSDADSSFAGGGSASGNHPVSPLFVYFLPNDLSPRSSVQVRRATVKDDTFSIDGLRPGSYYVLATAVEISRWADEEFLQAIEGESKVVTVSNDDHLQIEIALSSADMLERIVQRLDLN